MVFVKSTGVENDDDDDDDDNDNDASSRVVTIKPIRARATLSRGWSDTLSQTLTSCPLYEQ